MRSFLAGANLVFEQDSESKKEKLEDTSVLYEQIGRLQMDIAFLKKSYRKTIGRTSKVDRKNKSRHKYQSSMSVIRIMSFTALLQTSKSRKRKQSNFDDRVG